MYDLYSLPAQPVFCSSRAGRPLPTGGAHALPPPPRPSTTSPPPLRPAVVLHPPLSGVTRAPLEHPPLAACTPPATGGRIRVKTEGGRSKGACSELQERARAATWRPVSSHYFITTLH
ncbi:unnamed protein product [Danaus chrysippus]|uniref:(African queen) hypothetical protein n=1 Tax=Danaus chrysippus TaxID=151541 RepID=A0A8J2VZX6_9NEOP|nr:unnamed protein product [Danaus chrysippus]